jgi:hypothetical protein
MCSILIANLIVEMITLRSLLKESIVKLCGRFYSTIEAMKEAADVFY